MSDFEPPSVIWETHPRARKTHKCIECAGKIQPGEIYQKISGVWDSEFSSYKTCSSCERLRDWMRDNNIESYYGGVEECLFEADLPDMVLLAAMST